MPWANLMIFRDADTNVLYVHHSLQLSRRVTALAEKTYRLDGPRGGTWSLSSAGQVTTPTLRAHIDWLFESVIWPNQDVIRKLQGMRYWVCVSFHDDTAPNAAERTAVDAQLDALGISFDFEPERHEAPR